MNPYCLYLVTDDQQDLETLKTVVEEAVAGGVTMVQLREKHDDVRIWLERAFAVKAILQGTDVPLIINDRVDVALAVDADGVHIGQSDMPAFTVRRLIGRDKLLGLTIENEQQLLDAESLPVDYLGLSTIFTTPSKNDTTKEWGLEGLRNAIAESTFPIVAIGGINESNIDDIVETKADGVAIVSAICHASDPRQAAVDLLKRM